MLEKLYRNLVQPGQFTVLQSSVTEDRPLQEPPKFSTIRFVRVFFLCPPPQLLEQEPILHSFHSQFTAAQKVQKKVYPCENLLSCFMILPYLVMFTYNIWRCFRSCCSFCKNSMTVQIVFSTFYVFAASFKQLCTFFIIFWPSSHPFRTHKISINTII